MTAIIEDYSPVSVGDTGAPCAPVFMHKDGTPVDLTNATISMIMVSEFGDVIHCAGQWTIDNAQSGQAHYQYQDVDVAKDGMWELFITITINGRPLHGDKKLLLIEQVPS
jgi:hypothetical protein